MCKYSDSTGYKCPHESLKDSEHCIFHLQDDEKDSDEFNERIKEILETEEDLIYFNGFYFPPNTNFSGKIFRTTVFFLNTIFSGDANFAGAEFLGKANFKDVKFSGDADFTMSQFLGDVDFKHATFSKYADFFHATFSGDADFAHATFSGDARFIIATFSENADFLHATFSENADFTISKFLGDSNFAHAEFLGDLNFTDTTFLGDSNFNNAELTGKFKFIPDKSETIIFENTYFSDNVRIKADMSKCSFANSNIERVDMTDSIWIVDNKPKDSYKIWEERQGDFSSNWKELEGIYRRLKQSSQKFGDNDTAGKFYYQEMECKRKQLKGFKNLFWNVFYKNLCGYGEKPFNVIWFSGLIIFVSSLFFFYWGIELSESVVLNLPARLIDYKPSLNFQWVTTNFYKVIGDWLVCLYTSVITFTTLGYGDVHPVGWSRVVASVEAGIGIIMTALFIFVFTRKMLR